ncbi:Txe/YoeB family addiction module toxin [Entomobacter blattae]|uniref:Putative mRNA interferase YoeB n=1 Tax=Entomobacter blattae TaxID=2762277 RepID=A0A7H1NUG0_9PROT|nr:Txe/YoeB family addiction module toxin [Entomobacter blattae]QNT79420.1 Toxin YoeB [Entomobacter blattae]
MKVVFTETGWEDYLYWASHDHAMLAKVNTLVEDTRRHPFIGLGKPEALKGQLSGWWSRRITKEHRLVYRVTGTRETQQVEIIQCRYHY